MKKPYQIEAQRAVKQLDAMVADGNPAVQMMLPMAEMMGWLRKGVGELIRQASLQLMDLLMQEEVRELAGERSQPQADRSAHRWGSDPRVLNYLTVPQALANLPPALNIAGNNAIYAFDPAFRNPRSAQVSVSVDQHIDRNTKVTAGFTRSSTWALQRRIDVNLFPPAVLPNGFVAYPTVDSKGTLVQASGYSSETGQGIYVDSTGKALKASVVRPDPAAGQINVNKSVGHSSYNGAYLSVVRRMSHRVQFGLNYTYSVNRDDDSNERDFNRQYTLNVYDLNADRAYAKNDLRHNFNTNVLFDAGHGFTLTSLILTHSGAAGRYVIGSDLNNDGNKDNDRPVVNG